VTVITLGLLSRRAPLFGVVAVTQLVGMFAAIALGIARSEPLPQGADLAWSVLAGAAGMVGISALYRGLAVGRMGVVAPTTGVIGAVIPAVVGSALHGVPPALTVLGLMAALLAVVLVTRSPGRADGRPSGVGWALLAGTAIGAFDVCIAQLSDAGAFGPLAVMRLVQLAILALFVVAWRQPWRLGRRILLPLLGIGLLDMTGNASFIVAVQSGPLAIAAVLSSLYPIVTVMLARTLRIDASMAQAPGIGPSRTIPRRTIPVVRISAKVDYAVRAMCVLAAHSGDAPVKADQMAGAQQIPLSFLENILVDLKRAGLVRSLRGQVGGYRLARPATEISIANIIRAVEGPLADVRGVRPEGLAYEAPATALRDVWLANRVAVRRVLERVTIADLVSGTLPRDVRRLLDDPDVLIAH
jgi:Rrf2 family protein